MTFAELAKKMPKKTVIKKAVSDTLTIKGVANFIIEKITARLYSKGITADGTELRTNKADGNLKYSHNTVKIKQKKGDRWKNITLNDTGDFYMSYKVNVKGSELNISANFKKGEEEISDNFTIIYPKKEDFENAVTGMTDAEISELIETYINKNLSKNLYELL